MKSLTVTYGPTWPGHAALPAQGTKVGTARFRPLARLADDTGATIGDTVASIVVGPGSTLVLQGATGLPFKVLGSDRAVGSPRAPRYEVREIITSGGQDSIQTFTVEPYEAAGVAGTWDYRSAPPSGIQWVSQLPLNLAQATQYAQDFQSAAGTINAVKADAIAAAAAKADALAAAAAKPAAVEAAEYLPQLVNAKNQADSDHTRAATDHQQVVDNLTAIAQGATAANEAAANADAATARLEAALADQGTSTNLNGNLRAWAASGAYQITGNVTREPGSGAVQSADVQWPDGSAGVYTATAYNITAGNYDAYTITHAQSGKTVTQPAVTRDAAGNITTQPTLTITGGTA